MGCFTIPEFLDLNCYLQNYISVQNILFSSCLYISRICISYWHVCWKIAIILLFLSVPTNGAILMYSKIFIERQMWSKLTFPLAFFIFLNNFLMIFVLAPCKSLFFSTSVQIPHDICTDNLSALYVFLYISRA